MEKARAQSCCFFFLTPVLEVHAGHPKNEKSERVSLCTGCSEEGAFQRWSLSSGPDVVVA